MTPLTKMMKHLIPFIAFLLATVLLFSACNANENVNTAPETTPSAGTVPQETTAEGTTPEATTPEQTTPEVTLPDPVPLAPECAHDFTRRIVLEQVTTQTDGKIANVCGICGGWQEEILPAVKSLKILAIGNSFSDNALQYLPILAKELGIEEIIVGKLYRGSCTIDRHWSDAQASANYERFDLNINGEGWISQSQKTLIHALKLYDWDIITMQQASGYSGLPSSLGNLQNLIDYVNANKTNPDAKLYWHMTWAYSQFTTHGGFANYGNDQLTMYNAIVDLSKNHILPNGSFAGIIPAGTAVQNFRDDDTENKNVEQQFITSDGYHLQTYSRVLASLTWLRTLTGLSLDDINCKSNNNVRFARAYLKMLKKAANDAYLNPYEVTPLT